MFHIVSVDQQGYLTRAAHNVRVNVGRDPGVGTVYGRVRAMDGSDIAGALVTINRGLLTATNPDQTTNATGKYNHMGVPAGTWEIRAREPKPTPPLVLGDGPGVGASADEPKPTHFWCLEPPIGDASRPSEPGRAGDEPRVGRPF